MNPLNGYPADRATILFSLAIAVAVVILFMLRIHDTRLREAGFRSNGELQRVFDPGAVKTRVEEYESKAVIGDVLRGLALDTFLFIPAYVLALAIGCFRVAPVARLPMILGWAAVVAGVLDLIENLGIVLEVTRKAYGIAPLTATASGLKWLLIFVCAIFALIGPLLFRENRV